MGDNSASGDNSTSGDNSASGNKCALHESEGVGGRRAGARLRQPEKASPCPKAVAPPPCSRGTVPVVPGAPSRRLTSLLYHGATSGGAGQPVETDDPHIRREAERAMRNMRRLQLVVVSCLFAMVASAAPSDPLTPSPTWTAQGDHFRSQFGLSMAGAGDVNGDGLSDVIVGSPTYESVHEDEGRALVYLGSPSGLSTVASWQATGDQLYGGFGYSVAGAGDVNGDGYDEVIIGGPYMTRELVYQGVARVYNGSSSGLSTQLSWRAGGEEISALFGTSVASAGDVNADGFCDVIVGAPGNAHERGAAYLYQGSSYGLLFSPAWRSD